jgi:hypothetical protein
MASVSRHLWTGYVLVIAFVAAAAWTYAQGFVAPQPVSPVVLSGGDIGFRMTARKGATPVGRLVVKVDGEWKEVEFTYAIKPVTK